MGKYIPLLQLLVKTLENSHNLCNANNFSNDYLIS